MSIHWTRVTDQAEATIGTFKRTGELPEGTRYVAFTINGAQQIGRDFKPDYAIEVVERAITSDKAPADSYGVVEIEVDPIEVIESRKNNLKKARAAKAAGKVDENEEFTVCPLCSGTGEHDKGCENPAIVLKRKEA